MCIRDSIERAKLFGLDGLVLTEHSGQLYLSSDDYWHFKFLDSIDILYKAKKEKKDRMDEFRKKIIPLKNGYVKVGMEVESDKNGNITLLPEDREGIDYLLGAVHFIPEEYMVSERKIKEGFLKFTEFLCKNNIDILLGIVHSPSAYYILKDKDGVEKVVKEYDSCSLNIGTGMCIFSSTCLEVLDDVDGKSLEDFINYLIQEGYRASTYPIADVYFNINTWKDYERLLQHLILRGEL